MDSLETMACTLVASMLRARGLRKMVAALEARENVADAARFSQEHETAALLVEAILADLPRVDAIGSRGPMP